MMRINRVRLITKMAELDMSVNALVEKSGLSRCTVSAVRTGKACSSETATKIAVALGVHLEEIIKED